MARYPYIVNRNGVWYSAGMEVPADVSLAKAENTEIKKTYTKTEINRMSTADLKSFAAENEIKDAELKSGSELKKLLIEKLGL